MQDLWISRRGRFGPASSDSVGITAVLFFDSKNSIQVRIHFKDTACFENRLCHGNLCTSREEQRRRQR